MRSLIRNFRLFTNLLKYFFLKPDVDWTLAPWLMAGAVLSVPFAARVLKGVDERKAKRIVASVILLLGCLTLYKGFH